jgi:hypothetical protein
MSVAAHRLTGEPAALVLGQRLFTFPGGTDRRRKGEAKGFTWADYRDLILASHRAPSAPLVWVWDNLNIHLAPELVGFAQENEAWLRPLRACCYWSGSADAARSRATDPATTRAHPAAILGLRRCTARATQGTLSTAFAATPTIASTVSRRGQRSPHRTPMTIEPSRHCRPGGAYVPTSRAAATPTLPPGGARAAPMLRSGRAGLATSPR